jgi:hypothetical protein
LFACVSSTLKAFGLNPTHLGANMGMTVILHTHKQTAGLSSPCACRGTGW